MNRVRSREKGRVLIIAPFWRRSQHVGRKRVERFLRWLHRDGRETVLVAAGEKDGLESSEWGTEILIRDPLRLHQDRRERETPPWMKKEYPGWVRFVAGLVFNPDPGILWARRVAASIPVREEARRSEWILASSPPESAHLAARVLSTEAGCRLWVDMRDGWLDEPLKTGLQQQGIRRWREGRLERQVLESADRVTVTSPRWREFLSGRYPRLEERISVLPNCYPPGSGRPADFSPEDGRLVLVHAGQFTGSKFNNRPGLLLAPVLEAANDELAEKLTVVLRGRFTRADLREIRFWQNQYAQRGAVLDLQPPVPPSQLESLLRNARGLLLLSATRASILAKLFDYLPVRRPILALTPEGSSVWEIGSAVPQMFPVPLNGSGDTLREVRKFFKACLSDEIESVVPEEFMESHQEKIFHEILSATPSFAGSPEMDSSSRTGAVPWN